jgi:hypothetical protein
VPVTAWLPWDLVDHSVAVHEPLNAAVPKPAGFLFENVAADRIFPFTDSDRFRTRTLPA